MEKYFASGSAGILAKPSFGPGASQTSPSKSRVGNRRADVDAGRLEKLKLGLFDLISNVILLEADGKLHFRFAMEDTLSFKNLPADQRTKLKELYVDYFFRRQDDFWMREAMENCPHSSG